MLKTAVKREIAELFVIRFYRNTEGISIRTRLKDCPALWRRRKTPRDP